MDLISILSASYANTATDTAHQVLKKHLGNDFVGVTGGFEMKMMECVRGALLKFFSKALSEENKPLTMEPSQVSQVILNHSRVLISSSMLA